ncbi:glucoamylase family protein [Fictibacillus enclensis]|uniref:glucoamylase family protein n=1 Tax=Fictibacillus enclensis TaxID=1017270 RepID=UPI0025A1B252|nr:glucoamylase family protein [Fictibacillus enclensis]MDM5337100.1 glucoamylase family protein [Fictibacillus enclensis]
MTPLSNEELMDLESKHSFLFFWQEANSNPGSPGFGLIRDRAPGDPEMCSVASVGYGLTALVIGAERQWITTDEARQRAEGTLDTLLQHAEEVNGFFYHFLSMETGKRYDNSEVSVIDTAIAVCGAITAGEYFGGKLKEKAQQLYERVNWEWYRNPETNQFYMGYTPERGHWGAWDMYAEQFMMYFLAAASPTHPVDPEMFYDFHRQVSTYGDVPLFIYTWTGSLFTYQFSHAWFDLQNKTDRDGLDWWENSVKASLAHRQYCMDESETFKTFGPNSWGLTACDGPSGYRGDYGAPPSGRSGANDQHHPDGTVPPAGAIGSIPFTPKESLDAMQHYYNHVPELWGEYGFRDAYNLDVSPPWYGRDVIGIDKGISLLMIENHRTGLVWKWFMKNKFAKKGLELTGFTEKPL